MYRAWGLGFSAFLFYFDVFCISGLIFFIINQITVTTDCDVNVFRWEDSWKRSYYMGFVRMRVYAGLSFSFLCSWGFVTWALHL